MSLATASTLPALPRPAPFAGLQLRAQLVGAAERALHPHAHARELAPGLHELVAVVRPHGALAIPGRGELHGRGIADAQVFAAARAGTLREVLEFGRAGPLPGVHAHILGGPGELDTTAAILEICDRMRDVLGAHGLLFSVPVRGMALFTAPRAPGLTRALTRFGRQHLYWTCDDRRVQRATAYAALSPARAAAKFLASWTRGAHHHFPDPVSSSLYWHRPGQPIAVLTDDLLELAVGG